MFLWEKIKTVKLKLTSRWNSCTSKMTEQVILVSYVRTDWWRLDFCTCSVTSQEGGLTGLVRLTGVCGRSTVPVEDTRFPNMTCSVELSYAEGIDWLVTEKCGRSERNWLADQWMSWLIMMQSLLDESEWSVPALSFPPPTPQTKSWMVGVRRLTCCQSSCCQGNGGPSKTHPLQELEVS